MDYTRLYNALKDRVGFRSTFDPAYPLLHPDLLLNEGLIVNSVSEEFLSAETIDQYITHFAGMESVQDFALTNSYTQGDRVKVQNTVYRAIQNVAANTAITDATFWETALSYRLRCYKEDAARELLTEFELMKSIKNYTKRLIDLSALYSPGTNNKPIPRTGNFKGVELFPMQRKGVVTQFSQIGIRHDTEEALTYYLFHSSQDAPIQTFTIDILAADVGKFVWKDLLDNNTTPLSLRWRSDLFDHGGRFYFGTFEGGHTGVSSGYEFIWSYACSPCDASNGNINAGYHVKRKDYFSVRPIDIPSNLHNGTDLPNVGEYFDTYTYANDITFNLRYKTQCDTTDVIEENISLFDLAYQHKIAIKILQDMMVNNRVNSTSTNGSNESKFRSNINKLLYGQQSEIIKHSGLMKKYKLLLEQLNVEFSDENLDTVCFAQNNAITQVF